MTASTGCSKKLQPTSGLRLSVKTAKMAVKLCELLLVTGVRIQPSICIGSIENLRNFELLISRTHIVCGLLLTIRAASHFFKKLQARPESTSRTL